VTWLCTARRAPTWIMPDDQSPYRPYLVLVLEQETDQIRRTHIQDELPTAEEVLAVLTKAMGRSLLSLGRRITPARVVLDDAALVQALTPRLTERGIRCEYRAALPQVDVAWRELEAHLSRRESIPGLLSVPGATVPLVQELFAAAADYYRQAPWRWLNNSWPIEVRYPPDGRTRYAVVLGSGGEFFGLSLYESVEDLRLMYAGVEPGPDSRPRSWISLVFEEAMSMPFDDLDAMERYGWSVAGERAYPLFVRFTGPDTFTVPSALEMLWLAAVLRVVPDFVVRHLHADQGPPRPAEALYPLPNIHGGQQMALRYPVNLLEHLPDEAEAELEAFIEDWYWDEASHELARHLGAFLFQFLDDLASTGLSERTMRKHASNCWLIGKFVCDYGDHDTFAPTIFLGGPSYLYEFRRTVSDTPSAVASYKATWRKIERYVRSLGYRSIEGTTPITRRPR